MASSLVAALLAGVLISKLVPTLLAGPSAKSGEARSGRRTFAFDEADDRRGSSAACACRRRAIAARRRCDSAGVRDDRLRLPNVGADPDPTSCGPESRRRHQLSSCSTEHRHADDDCQSRAMVSTLPAPPDRQTARAPKKRPALAASSGTPLRLRWVAPHDDQLHCGGSPRLAGPTRARRCHWKTRLARRRLGFSADGLHKPAVDDHRLAGDVGAMV